MLRIFRTAARTRVQPLRVVARFKSDAADRYREQLQAKAKALGLETVDELKSKMKEDIEAKKKELNKVDPMKELEEFERLQRQEVEDERNGRDPNTINVRSPIDKDAPQLPYKTLHSYLDLEKVRELPKKELEFLWRARFLSSDRHLVALLDDIQFASLYANAFKNPSFILPLPKTDQGYEMHFVQWSFVGPHTTHCMLTTVAEYKLHKEYAKPHTTLMFHQDLVESNKLVLMNGQVETESSLAMDEAQLLVLNVQRFYSGDSKSKLALLQEFTNGNENFNMDALIKEATSLE